MEEPGEEMHLDVGGIVVDGGVVGTLFVGKHCLTLLLGEWFHHIYVLGPSACHTLVEYQLFANAPCFVGFEKCFISLSESVLPMLAMDLRIGKGGHHAGPDAQDENAFFSWSSIHRRLIVKRFDSVPFFQGESEKSKIVATK